MATLIVIVALVVLSSPFGEVEGRAVGDDNGLTVEITVAVDQTFEAVLVRPFSSFEELPPTALAPVDGDTWRGLVTFPNAKNWSMVFDGLEAEGDSFRSEMVTLLDIGVDPLVLEGDPVPLPERGMDAATWWLIGGMLAALAALGALAWWTFGPDGDDPEDQDESEATA